MGRIQLRFPQGREEWYGDWDRGHRAQCGQLDALDPPDKLLKLTKTQGSVQLCTNASDSLYCSTVKWKKGPGVGFQLNLLSQGK